MKAHPITLFWTYVDGWDFSQLNNQLSEEERDLFASIVHFPTRKLRVVSRAVLRHLLIDYYALRKEEIIFIFNERGKPALKGYPSYHFNCSHSYPFVLIGFSQGYPIGVDIEHVNELEGKIEIAQSFFTQEEYNCYKEAGSENPSTFFHFWTAKEAVIKALGKGLWEASQVPLVLFKNGKFFLQPINSTHFQPWSLQFLSLSQQSVACFATPTSPVQTNLNYLSPRPLNF